MKARSRRKATPTAATPEEAFLQAIHADITNPGPWQMYADWLEERGDPRAILYRERRATDAFGITFVTVPAGTFWMGGGGGKPGKEQRAVGAFQIGIYPVTQGQWEAVMGNNPSHFSRRGEGKNQVMDVSDEDLRWFPVETVSWNDAREYIAKLNRREQGSGWLYRLPSGEEWEYACRGGATSKEECSFHFYMGEPSDSISPTQANFSYITAIQAQYCDYPAAGPCLERTTKVGSYPPNRLGIHDMHGNVWEWCEDVYLLPADLMNRNTREVRGGGWHSDGNFCRASDRPGAYSESASNSAGFRLARVPSGRK